jgi:transcriptional regulator with XRE-family HTH domain
MEVIKMMTLLKEKRLQKGLQQCQLAKMAGLSISHLSRLENNWIKVSYLSAFKLAKALECEIADIYPELLMKEPQKCKH